MAVLERGIVLKKFEKALNSLSWRRDYPLNPADGVRSDKKAWVASLEIPSDNPEELRQSRELEMMLQAIIIVCKTHQTWWARGFHAETACSTTNKSLYIEIAIWKRWINQEFYSAIMGQIAAYLPRVIQEATEIPSPSPLKEQLL